MFKFQDFIIAVFMAFTSMNSGENKTTKHLLEPLTLTIRLRPWLGPSSPQLHSPAFKKLYQHFQNPAVGLCHYQFEEFLVPVASILVQAQVRTEGRNAVP